MASGEPVNDAEVPVEVIVAGVPLFTSVSPSVPVSPIVPVFPIVAVFLSVWGSLEAV